MPGNQNVFVVEHGHFGGKPETMLRIPLELKGFRAYGHSAMLGKASLIRNERLVKAVQIAKWRNRCMFLKHALRTKMIARRLIIPPRQQLHIAHQIKQHLTRTLSYQQAQHIAFYASFGSEVNTESMISHALGHHKNCYLPKLLPNGKLQFVKIEQATPLNKNQFGIWEPTFDAGFTIVSPQLDLVLVPLVAFDDHGHRLGMGKGYYDKTFAFRKSTSKPCLVGLGYACQHQNYVPNNDLDVSLDEIITEHGCHVVNKN